MCESNFDKLFSIEAESTRNGRILMKKFKTE